MDVQKLKEWFLKNKRDLPWRKAPSPYEVWISEVMLQQTQAVVVVDYFARWLEVFPSIEALARAPIEEVIKVWEGLGYYSRARNLHKAARYLLQEKGGRLPSSIEELRNIPGIGPYTAGAIASFAFHQKAAAIDGNVLRVISRHFCIEEDITKPFIQGKIKKIVEGLLPDREPWIVMEGLIELGAKICKKKPDCMSCPVKRGCKGKDKAAKLPFKGKKVEITTLTRFVAVICYGTEILVRKESSGRVMADLYEFPYWEERCFVEEFGLPLFHVRDLSRQRHSFTRFRAELYPVLWESEEMRAVSGYEWVSLERIFKLPFSSGHRHILREVLHAHFTH